jgi:hypothetical protein
MKSADKHVSTAARSWSNRADRRHSAIVDYSSELRSWVQCAILDAEEMKDFDKKGRFLSLLEDL